MEVIGDFNCKTCFSHSNFAVCLSIKSLFHIAVICYCLPDNFGCVHPYLFLKEESLMGRPGYEHLSEPLHILIEAEFPVDIVDIRLRQAQEIIGELLKPVVLILPYWFFLIIIHDSKLSEDICFNYMLNLSIFSHTWWPLVLMIFHLSNCRMNHRTYTRGSSWEN